LETKALLAQKKPFGRIKAEGYKQEGLKIYFECGEMIAAIK
jgi:hypothetical protein